ncbi:hypothetical protein BH24BAC1_BH24BAC1_15330 [soil metagenome]
MHTTLLLFHLLGLALGVGGATASDMLFIRSVYNRKVSADQFLLIRTLSLLVMVGLVLVVLSGLGFLILVWVNEGEMPVLRSSHFQTKMVAVFFLIINGIAFHSIVFKFLKKHVDTVMPQDLLGERIWVLALTGAVSITSWYGAFLLGFFGPIDISVWILLLLYGGLIGAGTLAAYLVLSHMFFRPVQQNVEKPSPEVDLGTVVVLAVLGFLMVGVLVMGVMYGLR